MGLTRMNRDIARTSRADLLTLQRRAIRHGWKLLDPFADDHGALIVDDCDFEPNAEDVPDDLPDIDEAREFFRLLLTIEADEAVEAEDDAQALLCDLMDADSVFDWTESGYDYHSFKSGFSIDSRNVRR